MVTVTLEKAPIKITLVTPLRTIKLDRVGLRGPQGFSAYQIWVQQPGNEGKSEADYLDWLANAQVSEILPYLTLAEAARDVAVASATSATGSAASALQYKNDAAASALGAAGSATTALNARDTAVAAKDTAVGAATTATAQAVASGQAKDAAVAAQLLAQTAATNSEAARVAAVNAKTAAETAATNADASKTAAQTAKTAAEAAVVTAGQKATDAEAARAAAVVAKTAAESAATTAGASSTAAQTAKTAAETARDVATQKAADAETARLAAVAAQGVATTKATEAEAARAAAVIAKTAAETAQGTATTQAGLAATAKTAAESARDTAVAAKTASEAARDLSLQYRDQAKQYRDEAEGIVGGDFLDEPAANLLYRRLDLLVPIAQVNGLQAALDSKTTAGDVQTAGDARYRRLSVALGISDITSLQTSLDAKAALAGASFTGKVNTIATAAGAAGLNIAPGTSPTSPVNGDIWSNNADSGRIYFRRNGSTYVMWDNGTLGAMIQAEAEAGTSTTTRIISALSLRQGADAAITARRGAASGIAPLDVNSKIDISYLPEAVLGAMKYQTGWNASTNTPAIPAAAAGNLGWYYIVSTAGSTNLSGITDWKVGDWAVSNGTSWDKIDSSDQVTSVAGKQGVVTLVKGDVGLGNVDNTSDADKPLSTATTTALVAKQNVAGRGAANGYASLDASTKIPITQLPTLSKSDVGLGNVDNTSDANKPISTAQQTALNSKQASHNNLTYLSGLTAAVDQVPYFNSSTGMAVTALTSTGRSLIGAATASAAMNVLVTPGTSGNVLTSTGTGWTSQAPSGGTGGLSYAFSANDSPAGGRLPLILDANIAGGSASVSSGTDFIVPAGTYIFTAHIIISGGSTTSGAFNITRNSDDVVAWTTNNILGAMSAYTVGGKVVFNGTSYSIRITGSAQVVVQLLLYKI